MQLSDGAVWSKPVALRRERQEVWVVVREAAAMPGSDNTAWAWLYYRIVRIRISIQKYNDKLQQRTGYR